MAHWEQTIYQDDRFEAFKRIEQSDFVLLAIQRGVRLASRTDQRTIRQPEKVDHRDMVWRPDTPRRVQKRQMSFRVPHRTAINSKSGWAVRRLKTRSVDGRGVKWHAH
jgi:hypothetical protein